MTNRHTDTSGLLPFYAKIFKITNFHNFIIFNTRCTYNRQPDGYLDRSTRCSTMFEWYWENGSLLCLLSKICKNLVMALTILNVMVKCRNVNVVVKVK